MFVAITISLQSARADGTSPKQEGPNLMRETDPLIPRPPLRRTILISEFYQQ
jgi:hypothetical protein